VERALTLDNRFIKQDTLYKPFVAPEGNKVQDFALTWVMDEGRSTINNYDNLPVEVRVGDVISRATTAGFQIKLSDRRASSARPHRLFEWTHPTQFRGLGFINDTKRVTTIPAGQTVRVEIVLGGGFAGVIATGTGRVTGSRYDCKRALQSKSQCV
jgi:hypothetical protein